MQIIINDRQLSQKLIVAAKDADISVDELANEALLHYLNFLRMDEKISMRFRKLNPEKYIRKINYQLNNEEAKNVKILEYIEDSAEYVSQLRSI